MKGLPLGFTQDEFFKGHSVPRNKEIMRIFRDLDMVEQSGSGIPRILEHYSRSVFEFTENFFRIVFPMDDEAVQRNTEQVTEQVKNLIQELDSDMDRQEIQNKLGLLHREHFRVTYLKPALILGLVEMTIPEKPNSKNRRYRLTAKGVAYRNNIVKK